MQKHSISKRSRRQRGILALVAREASQRGLIHGDAKITKAAQNGAILSFIDLWKQRTGEVPKELVFDRRFTTYAHLAKLHERGIFFLTLRKRAPTIIQQILERPRDQWKKIRLHNIGRKYATPQVLDQTILLNQDQFPVRQLAIKGLGHERPTLLITNHRDARAADLVDRYARRMLVEHAIQDALSSTIPLRMDLDLQLTMMASTLYQVFAHRLGPRYQTAKTQTLFRNLVQAPGKIVTNHDQIIVQFNRRSYHPELRSAGYVGSQGEIP